MIYIFYDTICYDITLNYRCFDLFVPNASKNLKSVYELTKSKCLYIMRDTKYIVVEYIGSTYVLFTPAVKEEAEKWND